MKPIIMAVIAAGAAAAATSAVAQPRSGYYGGGIVGHVHAESRYGHGAISGPVRVGPRGRHEVRMPGGTWIECAKNCRETLRRETIDFWENRGGRNGPVDGPAYLNRVFRR